MCIHAHTSLSLSLSLSLSFFHSHSYSFSLFILLSISSSSRRTSISMARSRPSLETTHSTMPFVAPLDDDRPLCHCESTLTTTVTLLTKDQVRSVNITKLCEFSLSCCLVVSCCRLSQFLTGSPWTLQFVYILSELSH